MRKRAIGTSVTWLLVTACVRAGAQTPADTILQCSGEYSSEGINAPKDVHLGGSYSNMVATYTIHGNVLMESGGENGLDVHYDLCRTTGTNYIYSTNCAVQRNRYIADWLKVTDIDSEHEFGAKYKTDLIRLDTVTIDRVSLRLDEQSLNTGERTDYDKKLNKAVLTPYFFAGQFTANCGLAKPKF